MKKFRIATIAGVILALGVVSGVQAKKPSVSGDKPGNSCLKVGCSGARVAVAVATAELNEAMASGDDAWIESAQLNLAAAWTQYNRYCRQF